MTDERPCWIGRLQMNEQRYFIQREDKANLSEDITVIVEPLAIEILRPDLVLEPGGESIRIEPPIRTDDGTCIQWFDHGNELATVTRERNTLLAAAQRAQDAITEVAESEVRTSSMWAELKLARNQLNEAVAACENGTRVQWFDQRDALLAAAKQVATCFIPAEPGFIWPGLKMRDMGPAAQATLDAIALCEKA